MADTNGPRRRVAMRSCRGDALIPDPGALPPGTVVGMIALYHLVRPEDTFEATAQMLFDLVLKAEAEYPGQARSLFIDIDGHRNDAGGFDLDMFELQKDFLIGHLGQYLSEVRTPIYHLQNPNQIDDLPEDLVIETP